ncbi:retrovirus-related pol polyprotein from transposon TNT 1-94 [Tanacetum coccineum]
MACDVSWKSKLSTLNDENVLLKTQVDSVVQERENIKLEFQKLFNPIKATRSQDKKEVDELIENVNQKTYTYANVRAQNQDLLMTISELKNKLRTIEKGKNVNTKSKPVTSQSTPEIKQSGKNNENVIARGMYKIIKKETKTPDSKANTNVSNSTGVENSNSVRRSKSKDTKLKNKVLKNTKSSSTYVWKTSSSASIDSNKYVFLHSHEKCVARYALSRNSNVKRALFHSLVAAKSNKLGATFVVAKSRLSVIKTPTATNKVIQLILWIIDSGCSKHMTGNLQLLRNFIEKFMGTVRFRNDHFAAITGYGDYVQGNLMICHVYYVEGLEGDDLLTGSRDLSLYTISISEMVASSPVCLMFRATSTKSWLWHRRLSYLNFGTINQLTSNDLVDGLLKFKYNRDHLCLACEQEKSKKALLPPKLVPSTESKLELLHMNSSGPMRIASINGKKYILVIVDDYSRYT